MIYVCRNNVACQARKNIYWLLKENSVPLLKVILFGFYVRWVLCVVLCRKRKLHCVWDFQATGRQRSLLICLLVLNSRKLGSSALPRHPALLSHFLSCFSPLFFRSLVTKTQRQACLYIVSNYLLSFILSVPLPGPLKMKWEGRSHCIAAPTAETLLPTNPIY